MKTVCFVFLFVSLVFGDTGEEKSVMEGENITLPSDIKQPNETKRWYFNDILIALINGESSKSCLYDGPDGRFRDRLKVDYKTGSLNITDITTEHAGHYEAEIIRGNSTGKSVPLNRKSKCDSTKIINKSNNNGNTIKTFNVHVNAVPDPGLPPAVPDPGLPPAVLDPGLPPAVPDPGLSPAVPDPGLPPAVPDPGLSPAVPDPGLSPAVPDPGLSPAVPDPGLPPAVPGSGLSPAAVAGIVVGVVVGVLLVAAAAFGVIHYRPRSSRNTGRKNNEEVL